MPFSQSTAPIAISNSAHDPMTGQCDGSGK